MTDIEDYIKKNSNNLTQEEKDYLKNYAEKLLKIKNTFEQNLVDLKSNVEFSKAVIDIIKQLTEDQKNVKRNS